MRRYRYECVCEILGDESDIAITLQRMVHGSVAITVGGDERAVTLLRSMADQLEALLKAADAEKAEVKL